MKQKSTQMKSADILAQTPPNRILGTFNGYDWSTFRVGNGHAFTIKGSFLHPSVAVVEAIAQDIVMRLKSTFTKEKLDADRNSQKTKTL